MKVALGYAIGEIGVEGVSDNERNPQDICKDTCVYVCGGEYVL